MEWIGPARELRNSGSSCDPARLGSPKSSVEKAEALDMPPRSRYAFVSYRASKKRQFSIELMLERMMLAQWFAPMVVDDSITDQ